MTHDAYCLCLLDGELADWIRRASPEQLRAFAFACAETAVERLHAQRSDEAAELAALLHDCAHADDPATVAAADRHLSAREDTLSVRLAALKGVSVPYGEFKRVAASWYAVRALRAALLSDRVTGAGRAAFAAIATTQDEAGIFRLATRGIG